MKLREPFYLAGLLWAALIMLPAPAAWAAEDDLDGKAAVLDRGVTTREGKSAIFTKFGVPTTGYYAGLPPGQALVLWSLCGMNTTCQWQALEDRKAHMGWGKVADHLKALNLTTTDKVGEAVRKVTDAHRDVAAKPERPEKLEKTGRMERPEHPGRPGR